MEKINLHNYEAFFLDHLEGNLSEQQLVDLEAFLNEHPQLNVELDEMRGFDDLILAAATPIFKDKANLKADPTILSAFTVDDWMIASVEGQLNVTDQKLLDKYIQTNGLAATLEFYQKTKLIADPAEVYTEKASLKRKSVKVIPLYFRYAAVAAAVVLLIGLTVFNSDGNTEAAAHTNNIIAASELTDYKSNFVASSKKFDRQNEQNPNGSDYNSTAVYPNLNPEIAISDSSETLPIVPEVFNDNQIVQNDKDTTQKGIIPIVKEKDQLPENDDVAVTTPTKSGKSTVTEEPYKLITNATGNLINRPMSFIREKETESNEYVAYHVKIGRFEFDRKKSR